MGPETTPIGHQPHFVLVPLLAQGHMIPMIDMARLLAEQGTIISLVTTPSNATRSATSILRSTLSIRVLEIPFPCQWAGLPPECENLDTLPSKDLIRNFYSAMNTLQGPLERHLESCRPPPSCIISDKCLSWTSETAKKFRVPRIVFHGMCCFSVLASHNIRLHRSHLSVSSLFEPVPIPGMPYKLEIKKAQLPGSFVTNPDLDNIRDQMQEAESSSYGVVLNTFSDLESSCIREYQKAINKPVWSIGPVSLCNKGVRDKVERGNKASIDEKKCLGWLDGMAMGSVIYACLGSQCRLVPSQIMELGLGLEASKHNFVWVVKTGEGRQEEVVKWLNESGFERRVQGRGLVIKGWAPQVLILSHCAVGGFLTHCGWNSVIEGLSCGVPLVTWPQFAEQFLNEKLVIEVLRVGVRVGVEMPVRFGEEENAGVLVTRDDVSRAVNEVMEMGEEGEERKRRALELGKMARKAVDMRGSSRGDLAHLVEDVRSACFLKRNV